MMPVAGKPMIWRVLDMLASDGVDGAVVVVHPSDAKLISSLTGPSPLTSVHLAYQEKRLGMAHALQSAVPFLRDLGEEEFVLASCDNLYRQNHVADLIALRRRRPTAERPGD